MGKQVTGEKLENKYIIAIRTKLSKLEFDESDKEAVVYDFTDGRTKSISGMTKEEAISLISSLGKDKKQKADESRQRMIRKIYGLCHDLGWQIEEDGKLKVNRKRMWGFIRRQGFDVPGFYYLKDGDLIKIINGLEQTLKSENK